MMVRMLILLYFSSNLHSLMTIDHFIAPYVYIQIEEEGGFDDDVDMGKDGDDDDDDADDGGVHEFVTTWDPLDPNGDVAPEGWFFPGFMAFVCFGPSSRYFALLLQMGGIEKQQAVGRNQLRKQQKEREAVSRRKEGTQRGIAKDQQMRDARAVVPRHEIVSEMRHENMMRERELRVITISKRFDMAQKVLDTKMKLMEYEMEPEKKSALVSSINDQISSIEQLDKTMEDIMNEASGEAACTGNA